MIRTRAIPISDLLARVPEGASVGILGCGDCAAVLNTGGTRQVEELAGRFEGRNPVVFRTVLEAPCDQRVLRRLVQFIPEFDRASFVIVLACPAGVQSLASLVKTEGRPPVVVAGLVASGLGLITSQGARTDACIFCPECTFDPNAGLCPIALCPLHKGDGPCQNRLADDHCPVSPSRRCIWCSHATDGEESA